MEPSARRRYLVALDPERLRRVQKPAQSRGLATESLVNLLLEQRLHQLAGKLYGQVAVAGLSYGTIDGEENEQ